MSDIKLPKLKWRASPSPTGRYRSFYSREWPSCEYEDGTFCASIICTTGDEYVPSNVRDGTHGPLKLRIANHTQTNWTSVYSTNTYPTLKLAKEALSKILKRSPHLIPEKYKSSPQ